ncbi:hypothetical protein [uncultured Bacteroides sp.]|uniref:hypothetical protein n=1 Tax=uncultured Bacteroides sp. TaxID=162156 RepID=UPI0026115BF3|nr:hypothetical protein [uncultured Bacteroides sp.]
MGKLALKIFKALYGLDIEAQSTELTRLRLENKRLSELLKSTSREYNVLNDKYKKKKESLSNEYGVVSDELNELKGKYEALVMEKENLENTLKENSEKFKEETDRVSLESEKMSGEIESLQKVIEGLNAEKDTLEKEKETLCKEKETLGTEKENLAKELEAINKEKVALNSEKDAAIKELESIKERYLTEKESLSKELKSLNELHKAEKENQNSEYELVADELKALKEKYEALVKEKEELEKSAKENSEKHKEETSKISFESEKMSGEIENLQKVIKGLNAEKDALIKEKENLRNENETLLQEKNVLNSEKESLDKKNEELGKENETLNKEKEVLGKEIKSANEAHIADKDKLKKEIDSLGKEIASLKELYQKEKEENTTLSEKVKTLESEIANFSLTAQMKEEVYSVIEKEDEELPAVETSIDEKSEKITDDEEEMKEMMQKEIISLTQKYDYIRVTTTIGNQYIYQSRHFQLRTGLFDWGIEGKEIITDEILYLENSAVTKMEGLDSPFDGEEIICNMEDEDSASAVADSLLMAICTYQPIQVNYHDKNGRTTLKNLYHVTFKPLANKFSLPYKNLFRDMLDEKIDAEQLSALCPHNPEPRNFAIPQIQTLRRFNAFFTTKEGIETMKEGIKLAQDAEQTELAEVLMSKIQN